MVSGSPSKVKIIIHAPNGDTREFTVTSVPTVVGRDESADVRVNDKKVSRRHVSFRLADGEVQVEDLGSVNGVNLDGKRVEGSSILLLGSEVSFGGYRVTRLSSEPENPTSEVPESQMQDDSISQEIYAFLEPRMSSNSERSHLEELEASTTQNAEAILIGLTEPVADERFVLQRGENIIGRLEDCDVPILHESISRQHARISLRVGETRVEDLQSSNGTFVNDEKVKEASLSNSDRVKVGSVEFRLELPAQYQGASRSIKKILPSRSKKNSPIGKPQLVALFCVAVFFAWFFTAASPVSRLSSIFAPESKITTKEESGETVNTSSKQLENKKEPDLNQKNDVSKDESSANQKAKIASKVATSTSPFGRRDASGWPVNVPAVDPSFDFDKFVEEKLTAAETQLQAKQFLSAQETLIQLRKKDPVNGAADALSDKIIAAREANAQFGKALELEKAGKMLQALLIYQSLISEENLAKQAQEKLSTHKTNVLQAEIEKVRADITASKNLRSGHRALLSVLQIDESNTDATELIWKLEKKMRAQRIRFKTYSGKKKLPVSEVSESKAKTPREQVLAHLSNDELTSSAMHYLAGDYKRALRTVERASFRNSPKGKSYTESLRRVKKKYERVRTALGNDPSEAWFYLRDFRKAERAILPDGLESFWRNELEASIADAYASQGDTLYAQQKYAAAFSKWDAGAKLRPNHVKIIAGFEKLNTLAKQLRNEAELKMQQAQPGACDRWRQITRITKSSSEPYMFARQMAGKVCRK